MKILCSIPEKGYAPSMKVMEKWYEELPLFNPTRGAVDEIEKVLNLTPATMVQMVKLYDFTDTLYPCVKIDVNIYPCVVKNHNGYCIQWYSEEKPSEMSIEDYLAWKNAHVAKWINEQWVYVPVVICNHLHTVYNDQLGCMQCMGCGAEFGN